MSTEPVLIEDDDVDMEPVVILDEDNDKINSTGTVTGSTLETIDLDEDTPTDNNTGSVNQNVITADETNIFLNKSELSFINNLKNNKLMDQIVSCCLNMPNALGMTRVINKTVIPLYKDANRHYKESSAFRKLLKNTLKLLTKDPDHKFLHVKTLCEELKSGGLRKKVPFVTLATNVNNHRQHFNGREIQSHSRVSPQTHKHVDAHHNTNTENSNKFTKYISGRNNMDAVKKKTTISDKVLKSYSKKTRSYTKYAQKLNEKTDDVINLDNSDSESVIITLDSEDRNCITITEERESDNNGVHSNKNNFREWNQEIDDSDRIGLTEVTLDKDYFNRGNVTENPQEVIVDSNKSKVAEDCNKENKKQTNENHKFDDSLLIPQNHVEVVIEETVTSTPNANSKRVAEIEKKIAEYKQLIAQLEETEVSTDNEHMSPYLHCARLKKQVVLLYKQLCKINGYCEDIVKRREIRLQVAEGHPPGPAKRLEQFLNNTIDSTGSVEFPDFPDVVKCVFEANIIDELGWDTQRKFREASALFHHCGQALRKRRQQREYRDLLSIVKDKELTDDPAESDPLLQAKLEENKRIAKIKEESILERYVNMERQEMLDKVQFETNQDSTDSESDSEPNIPINNVITTATVNGQCTTGESSNTNIITTNLDVRLDNNISNALVNNIATTTMNNIVGPTINFPGGMGESSINNIVDNSNIYLAPVNNYIVMPPIVNYQSNLGGISNNNDFSYYYVLSNNMFQTNNTITNITNKPVQCLNNNITSSNNLYLTITPGSVPNIQTKAILYNSERSSGNNIQTTAIRDISQISSGNNIQTTAIRDNIQISSGNNIQTTAIRDNIQISSGNNIQTTAIRDISQIRSGNNIQTTAIRDISQIRSGNNIQTTAIRDISQISSGNNIQTTAIRGNIQISSGNNIQTTAIKDNSERSSGNNIQTTAIRDNIQISSGNNIQTTAIRGNIQISSGNNIQTTAILDNSEIISGNNIQTTAILDNSEISSGNNIQTTEIIDISEMSSGNNNKIIQNPDTALPISGPNINSVPNCKPCPSKDLVQNNDSSVIEPSCEIKLEDQIKKEPAVDFQNMLDELGDNFEYTVYDIEDPFLVIEISSDGFSDDDQ